jgi:hypothetical protein
MYPQTAIRLRDLPAVFVLRPSLVGVSPAVTGKVVALTLHSARWL